MLVHWIACLVSYGVGAIGHGIGVIFDSHLPYWAMEYGAAVLAQPTACGESRVNWLMGQ